MNAKVIIGSVIAVLLAGTGAYKKIEGAFTDAFLEKDEASENGYTLKTGKVGEKVVGGYKAIENGVVKGYKNIEDKFVQAFLDDSERD